jgi:hypothetical protein
LKKLDEDGIDIFEELDILEELDFANHHARFHPTQHPAASSGPLFVDGFIQQTLVADELAAAQSLLQLAGVSTSTRWPVSSSTSI